MPEEGTKQRHVMAPDLHTVLHDTQNSAAGGEEEADEEEQRAERGVGRAGRAGQEAEPRHHGVHRAEGEPPGKAEGYAGLLGAPKSPGPAHPAGPGYPGHHDSHHHHRGLLALLALDQTARHVCVAPCCHLAATAEERAPHSRQQLTPPPSTPTRSVLNRLAPSPNPWLPTLFCVYS